jgi:hypothetical protein
VCPEPEGSEKFKKKRLRVPKSQRGRHGTGRSAVLCQITSVRVGARSVFRKRVIDPTVFDTELYRSPHKKYPRNGSS